MAKILCSNYPDHRDFVAKRFVATLNRDLFNEQAKIIFIHEDGWITPPEDFALYAFPYESVDCWKRTESGRFFGYDHCGYSLITNEKYIKNEYIRIRETVSYICRAHTPFTNIFEFTDYSNDVDVFSSPILSDINDIINNMMDQMTVDGQTSIKSCDYILCSMLPWSNLNNRCFRVSINLSKLGISSCFHVEVNGPVAQELINDGRKLRGWKNKTTPMGIRYISWGYMQSALAVMQVGNEYDLKMENVLNNAKFSKTYICDLGWRHTGITKPPSFH